MRERTVSMTPELAEKYLEQYCEKDENNKIIGQRNVSWKTVEKYANDMKNGRWPYLGDPIRISDDGKLIDGQHRLIAVTLAGVPVKLRIIDGIPMNHDGVPMIGYFDIGKKRSVADGLSIDGMKYSQKVASVARTIFGVAVSGSVTVSPKINLADAKIVLSEYQDEVDTVVFDCMRQTDFRGVQKTAYMSALCLVAKVHRNDAIDFNMQVTYGEGLKRGMPAYALRNTLINMVQHGAGQRQETFFATLNAAKRFIDGESLTYVKRNGMEAFTYFTTKQRQHLESIRVKAGF